MNTKDQFLQLSMGFAVAAAFLCSSVEAEPPMPRSPVANLPAMQIPFSSYSSSEAAKMVSDALAQAQPDFGADIGKARAFYGKFNDDRLAEMRAAYAFTSTHEQIGGIPVDVVLPSAGVAPRNAEARAAAIRHWSWDRHAGVFRDVLWKTGESTPVLSAATLYPLFTGLATPVEAQRVAATTEVELMAEGGLRTTTQVTHQQWDRPNGWAPLQWIAIKGLEHYGETDRAQAIAGRWRKTVLREYTASGRLLEKYDVDEVKPGGGGEYPLQDGFGWTNGVMRALRDID